MSGKRDVQKLIGFLRKNHWFEKGGSKHKIFVYSLEKNVLDVKKSSIEISHSGNYVPHYLLKQIRKIMNITKDEYEMYKNKKIPDKILKRK